jgi:hypothetical protein
MPTLQNQLSLADWIQLFAVVGQCASGVGALLAAWFAYRTVNQIQIQSEQMRSQVETERSSFIAQYGPKLYVNWTSEDHVTAKPSLDKFPQSVLQIEHLPNGPEKRAYEVLAKWWEKPSDKASPSKFVVLNIQNSQADSTIGIARNLCGTLSMSIRYPERNFPPHHLCEFDFSVGDCRPGDMLKLPIRIEGVPDFTINLISLRYEVDGNPQPLNTWVGNSLYAFPD